MMPSRRVKDMDLAISLATQIGALFIMIGVGYVLIKKDICTISESKLFITDCIICFCTLCNHQFIPD